MKVDNNTYYNKTLHVSDKITEHLLLKCKSLGEGESVKDFFADMEGQTYPDWEKFLLPYLSEGAHILDFGCGFGHSAEVFLDKGFKVTAFDGSKNASELASIRLGFDVECKRFDELDDLGIYDAIWANVSLLHVPKSEHEDIYNKMIKALKPSAYIYASYKEGSRDGFYSYQSMNVGIELENYFSDFT